MKWIAVSLMLAVLGSTSGCCCWRSSPYGAAYAPPAMQATPVYQSAPPAYQPAYQSSAAPAVYQPVSYTSMQACPPGCVPVCP